MVCMRADDKVQERQLVEKVVEEARKVMGGQSWEVKSGFWDGLGICTWESFMNRGGMFLLLITPCDSNDRR